LPFLFIPSYHMPTTCHRQGWTKEIWVRKFDRHTWWKFVGCHCKSRGEWGISFIKHEPSVCHQNSLSNSAATRGESFARWVEWGFLYFHDFDFVFSYPVDKWIGSGMFRIWRMIYRKKKQHPSNKKYAMYTVLDLINLTKSI
jgi:hypothetical protein